jgi:hypothetical protein
MRKLLKAEMSMDFINIYFFNFLPNFDNTTTAHDFSKIKYLCFPHIDRGCNDRSCERSVYDSGGSWVILLGSIPPALQQRRLAPHSLMTLTLAGSDD